MLKNIFSIRKLSIIVVLVLALSACSGGRSDENGEIDIMDYLGIEGDLEPEEIHIYMRGFPAGGIPRPSHADEFENMLLEVSMILSDSLKATPVFHWLRNNSYVEDIERLVKSGERVDAFTTYGEYEFSGRDVRMDISGLFPQYAPNYYNELMSHAIGIQKLDNLSVEGRLECIPNNNFSTNRAFVLARKDLAEQFVPNGFNTLEDYGEFMARVKEQYPQMNPGTFWVETFFSTYLFANGYFQYQSPFLFKSWDPQRWEEYYPMERLEEFSDAYYMLKDWHDKGYIQPIFNQWSFYRDIEPWLSMGGMASVLLHGTDVSRFSLGSEHEFIVEPLYMDCSHELLADEDSVAVSTSCDCPERVIMYFEWVHSSQDAYDLFLYGVENRNYVLNGDRISFVSDEFELEPFHMWPWFYYTDYFADFRYDRLREYHPDGFKDMYRDASLDNIFTTREIAERILGVDTDSIDSFYNDRNAFMASMGLTEELDRMQNIIESYNNNLYEETRVFNRGNIERELADIIEMQTDTGIDEYIDFHNRLLKNLRGN